ncbi:hypothetical protein SH1V18_22130 [Vallitalea longa]|uniref:N-acetyltransferase domain-containing protein n=1 Tax=Vallitalea longa TaxID=2936439 RepID=A0A9W6DFS6_9FIRM|nr:GNAT family N-acetyltransferase [Vallitalea longa]GKX29733.1 hypothetical protein SH1V18_22130 [Vallitalea longa]
MDIVELSSEDILKVNNMWNEYARNGEFVHKDLEFKDFNNQFIRESEDVRKVNFVAKEQNEIIGFSNGSYKEESIQGYITFVLIRKEYRFQGIGNKLLEAVEDKLLKIGKGRITRFDILFFNPINLEWFVPRTNGHDHPNAPGVDVSLGGYIFFKNNGYRDVAYENSYYRELENFEFSDKIHRKILELKQKDITITYYDRDKHHGLNELFDDFNNELWRETIMKNVNEQNGGKPVLIVEHKGKVCGFTGPLYVQPSGRGYFAGIGIHSDYRKLGAGKVLFSYLCKSLKDQGASFMTLFTGEKNPARNIYESAGFKIIKTWADMRKEINQNG